MQQPIRSDNVRKCPARPELVQILHVLGQIIRIAVEELVLVDRTVGRAFTGGAVVGSVEDDGVVELPGLLQVVDDTADLHVGVFREPGKDLGQARKQFLLVGIERFPRPHMVCRIRHVFRQRIERSKFGALRHDALGNHARQNPLAIGVVAVVKLALVLVDVFLRGVVRGVIGTRTVPHEPRL